MNTSGEHLIQRENQIMFQNITYLHLYHFHMQQMLTMLVIEHFKMCNE